MLRLALNSAKLGDTDKIEGLKRLDRFARAIEQRYSPQANFEAVVKHERAISPQLDGRTAFNRPKQMSLFP